MTPPDLVAASLRGLCPACGARTLFDGPVRFAPQCRACGLDFGRFNVGDGPAAFLTLGIGAVVTIAAVLVELRFSPPALVHLLLWVPLTLGLTLISLRAAKAALIFLEHRNQAREGRIEP
ncbi:DUF983 domain-containing protein [Sphingomonas changnyeongensis]|uniref:DUF983 domain-containing protein n=1 Tax=Sphingomonas changnyeongensis TaxID=2698679 RepID=A0A7Z2S4C7_9SPHN|nr:DUF983 domain-containing protein [Sphingomonas changnyeongensis]QHL89925.1 DUF983 domain-containing protein [Sphingomonas changnyeongensis]